MTTESVPARIYWGIGIALVAYIFFVSASSFVATLCGRIPMVQVLFIQNVICLVWVLPAVLHRGIHRLKTGCLYIHLVRDLFGGLSYYLYFLAIRYLEIVDATILNYTSPFFVPFVWWIWIKEKVAGHVWWSIVVGFIGVAVILNPSTEMFQLGFVFGLFAGISSAVALCAVRVLSLRKEPMTRILFYFFSTSALVSLPFAWARWIHPTLYEWLQILGVGISTAIGQMLLTIAYRHGTAAYLSPLGYSTVIYAGLVAYFFFGESLGLRTLVGAILIILGGSVTYLIRKKPKSLAETFEAPTCKDKPHL